MVNFQLPDSSLPYDVYIVMYCYIVTCSVMLGILLDVAVVYSTEFFLTMISAKKLQMNISLWRYKKL